VHCYMGTNILKISVIANRSSKSKSSNDNSEKTNEFLLLETPSKASVKQSSQFSLGQSIIDKAAKIGKIAKLSNRKIRDERPVFSAVSH
jgi:hypothetical protein